MKRWLLISLVLTIVTLGGTLFLYAFGRGYMPDPVPVHWDIEGKANQWVPRDQALPYLLIGPGAMAGVILLGLLLPWLSPKPFDVERFRPTDSYFRRDYQLPSRAGAPDELVITVDRAVNPFRLGKGGDKRDLGLRVSGMSWKVLTR